MEFQIRLSRCRSLYNKGAEAWCDALRHLPDWVFDRLTSDRSFVIPFPDEHLTAATKWIGKKPVLAPSYALPYIASSPLVALSSYFHDVAPQGAELEKVVQTCSLQDYMLSDPKVEIGISGHWNERDLFSKEVLFEQTLKGFKGINFEPNMWICFGSGEDAYALYGLSLFEDGEVRIRQIQGAKGRGQLSQILWRDLGIQLTEQVIQGLCRKGFPFSLLSIPSAYNNKYLFEQVLHDTSRDFDEQFGPRFNKYNERFAHDIEKIDTIAAEIRRRAVDVVRRYQRNYDLPALRQGYAYDSGSRLFLKAVV